MSNPFAKLKENKVPVEETKDTIGGFTLLESDVYPATCKMAFAGQSSGGAGSITFHFDIDGQEHRETIYVTNKAGETFYTNKKNGKNYYLPGYVLATQICLLCTGYGIEDLVTEERVVKLWNWETKQEENTKVPMFVDMMNKPIKLGILQQIVDKNVSDGQGGYVPSGETRTENVINTAYHHETNMTVNEYKQELDKAVFMDKWLKKHKNVTEDKSTKVIKSGRPVTGTAPKSMFS